MTSEPIGDYVIGSHDSSWSYLILSMDAMRKYNIQSNTQLNEHYRQILQKAESFDTLMKRGETEIIEENKRLKEDYRKARVVIHDKLEEIRKLKEILEAKESDTNHDV
jgi:TRAP-type C4-dicarboxylate transport system substrate-binding protein